MKGAPTVRGRQGPGQTGRVIVIGPYLRMRRGDADAQANDAVRDSEARLEEAAGLARAIDLTIADALIAPISQIRPATYLGKGKVEEIAGLIAGHDIELVVMDCALSPIQQRNLEKAWNTKVLDRTGLILEIFGRRAKTKEGALQVELAHLNYQRSRLVRSWTHLERQRGGFGFMGGPGETQIEADRRLIGDRIARLENELKKVQATRRLHRAGRQRVPYPRGGAGRLHQRRQVDAVQPADARRRAGGRHAVCDARSDLARAEPAAWRQGDAVRHRRLHLQPADAARGRLPRHAGRGAGGRHHSACPRHLA